MVTWLDTFSSQFFPSFNQVIMVSHQQQILLSVLAKPHADT
jgi:hypothetical protein